MYPQIIITVAIITAVALSTIHHAHTMAVATPGAILRHTITLHHHAAAAQAIALLQEAAVVVLVAEDRQAEALAVVEVVVPAEVAGAAAVEVNN